jgi:Tfp pilus assembly protein PilX
MQTVMHLSKRSCRAARSLARRISVLHHDERGVTLVLVLVMVAALTMGTASLSALVISNTKAFGRDSQEARAFNAAEAGLNYGVSRLTTFDPTGSLAVNSSIGSVDAPQLFTLDGGLGNGGWWAVKRAPTVWTVYARAVAPNGSLSRLVAVDTTTNTTTTNIQASAAWGYGLFVASPSGCATVVGNSAVTMPVFITSDICFQGTSGIQEPNASGAKSVTLYVGGKVTTGGGATVGTATRKIISATIVGGCNGGTAAICSNSSFSKVYADTYSSAPSSLTKPPLYLQATYDSGDWKHPVCSVGSFTFDSNATMDGTTSGFNLFPASAYDCTVRKDGNTVGRLAWSPTTQVLTVQGVIFLDGNLSIGGGSHASYVGTAAIYVNGSVNTQGNSALCGPGATVDGSQCDGLWNAQLGALGIVATKGWSMSGTAEFNVLAYVVGNYDDGGNARVTGPIITDTVKVHGTSDTTSDPSPPPGMPGSAGYTSSTTWNVMHGTWRELPETGG